MKPRNRRINLVPLARAGVAVSDLARAHGGHGEAAEHWHASDIWGFMMLAALIGGMLWLRRGRK